MFVNPLLLFGLPLAALPIIIHLINRQRHRTVPWGAMMFLLDAKRLQRSMAKLRYWLIMAMRVLSIIALFVAASRPLASGWLGNQIGSSAETVLLLLDRSPSMEQTDAQTQRSKRAVAIERFADLMRTTGEGKRVVLIESTRETPEEINVAQLDELPSTKPSDAMASIPSMLESASKYLVSNQITQADIWIASDLRAGDWHEEDGRWAAVREQLSKLPAVRLHLLSYPRVEKENRSLRVLRVRRRELEEQAEVRLEIAIAGAGENAATIPVEFELNGATSVLEIELKTASDNSIEHTIPIPVRQTHGWGRVALPADRNNADNVAYFVFGPEPVRRTVIVSDDMQTARPFRIAASAGSEPELDFETVTLSSTQLAEIDWSTATLLIWHAPLPEGILAKQLQAHLNQGRPIICLPPLDLSGAGAAAAEGTEFGGVRWQQWQEVSQNAPVGIGYWDNESDLLARTQSGDALPVGKQVTRRYCTLVGSGRRLAKFTNDADLLVKPIASQPLYFLSTLPRPDYSTLAEDGVTLYAMVQRAIEIGASNQSATSHVATGTLGSLEQKGPSRLTSQTLLSSTPAHVVEADLPYVAGCHQADGTFWSLNRSLEEDDVRTLDDETLERLFAGLDFQSIEDQAGSESSLVNEIWRLFLVCMAVALIVEAYLCL